MTQCGGPGGVAGPGSFTPTSPPPGKESAYGPLSRPPRGGGYLRICSVSMQPAHVTRLSIFVGNATEELCVLTLLLCSLVPCGAPASIQHLHPTAGDTRLDRPPHHSCMPPVPGKGGGCGTGFSVGISHSLMSAAAATGTHRGQALSRVRRCPLRIGYSPSPPPPPPPTKGGLGPCRRLMAVDARATAVDAQPMAVAAQPTALGR